MILPPFPELVRRDLCDALAAAWEVRPKGSGLLFTSGVRSIWVARNGCVQLADETQEPEFAYFGPIVPDAVIIAAVEAWPA